jgi:anti-sigma regulatory factor (Ser/Thr protein kinase)
VSSHDGQRPQEGDQASGHPSGASEESKRCEASEEFPHLAGTLWPDVELDWSLAPLVCTGIAGQPGPLVAVRHNLQRWAAHTGLSTLDVADLVLASYEALANAVEHAYPSGGGPVDLVAARAADGRVLVAVRDYGRWRPPPSDPGSRGRGLPMINTLAHRAAVLHSAHGTYVRMEWQLSATVGATGRKQDDAR